MSWPQNPQQPHQPQQPPEATAVDQPAVAQPPGTVHHQPTVFAQPAVTPPAPAPNDGGTHAQATVFAQPAVQPPGPPGSPGPGGASAVPPPPPPPGGWTAPHPAPAPAPPNGGSGNGGGKNKTLLAVVGGVVALAVIGGGAFFFLKGGDDKKDDQQNVAAGGQAKPSGDPAQGQPQGQSQQSAAPDAAAGNPAAPPAGWQTQTSKEHKLQYDVPAAGEKWKVFPQDTMIAYTDASGKPQISMRDTANYSEGGCASSANPNAIGEAGKGQLATVGTAGGDSSLSIQENARNWAGNWGVYAYGGLSNKPKIEVTQAKPWKQNGIDGWTATAKVKVTNRPSPCVPPTAIVKSIVWKLPSGEFSSWIVYADQGVSGALPESRIDEIMKTVRPLKG